MGKVKEKGMDRKNIEGGKAEREKRVRDGEGKGRRRKEIFSDAFRTSQIINVTLRSSILLSYSQCYSQILNVTL